jgi:hypothetical protein
MFPLLGVSFLIANPAAFSWSFFLFSQLFSSSLFSAAACSSAFFSSVSRHFSSSLFLSASGIVLVRLQSAALLKTLTTTTTLREGSAIGPASESFSYCHPKAIGLHE